MSVAGPFQAEFRAQGVYEFFYLDNAWQRKNNTHKPYSACFCSEMTHTSHIA